eukprot:2986904-Pyramimonas_sp.AAC.1
MCQDLREQDSILKLGARVAASGGPGSEKHPGQTLGRSQAAVLTAVGIPGGGALQGPRGAPPERPEGSQGSS